MMWLFGVWGWGVAGREGTWLLTHEPEYEHGSTSLPHPQVSQSLWDQASLFIFSRHA